jgi:hypothetical protein
MWSWSFFRNLINGRDKWLKQTANIPNPAPILQTCLDKR